MKKILISLVAIVLMMGSVPAGVFAATTTKAKMYEIQVTKHYAYVVGNKGIYRVKLKSGKPVSKKKIVKCGSKYSIGHLKVKGKYVYFKKSSNTKDYLYRVKKSGGKAVKLASMGTFSQVAIKDKKIYYSYPGEETDDNGMVLKTYKKVMKLNGKGKKDTETEAEEIDKYHSKKGYKYTFKVTKKNVMVYLKTPKGKIKLETL